MGDEPSSYRRTVTGFVPVSPTAQRFWAETKLGDVVKLDGKRPRNLARLRLYWKMLEIVADNSEIFTVSDEVHLAVKAALGLGKWVDVGASKPLFIEDSISFHAMRESEFSEYLDKAARVISKYWLHVPVETLLAEAAA